MSSNLRVNRVCVYCQKDFTALTTTTKYCSKICNNRHYKQRQRESKIHASNEATKVVKKRKVENLSTLEFLTVTQASKLLNCSRQNIYKLINSGKLLATNILEKKTLVKREDIEALFKTKDQHNYEAFKLMQPLTIDFNDCLPLKEIEMIFGISSRGLYTLIQRHHIPRIKYNKKTLIPKNMIEHVIKN